ncbi:hypothetical protein HK105_208727 [Polyrhizophydium stewartii]|uniref:Expansin-like EG45 domain-containing protein n=1 Tax=Polyrhizophydium stewartii TaxID=2732419 RepID=A0ABR4MX44_9FUNG
MLASTLLLSALVPAIAAQGWQTGRCTYHPYQEDLARLGSAYDNSPGWCGIRYTALDITRVVAIRGVTAGQCAQCLEFRNAAGGPSEFVLIIDEKGAEGLDISRSSFSSAFPGQNPLDPQTCAWRIVDPSNCAGICRGSALECTPGQRNLLPASQLPPLGSSGNSGGSNSGGNNSGGNNNSGGSAGTPNNGGSGNGSRTTSSARPPTTTTRIVPAPPPTSSSRIASATRSAAASPSSTSASAEAEQTGPATRPFVWPSPDSTGSPYNGASVPGLVPMGTISGARSAAAPSLGITAAAALLIAALVL